MDCGYPVTVTFEHESDESPPSSNPVTEHTYLSSECTVVAADVHLDTVFNLFNIRKQVGNTARYVHPFQAGYVLPYVSYTRLYRCDGCGFQAV